MLVAFVLRPTLDIRRWQALEGVRHPHLALGVAIGLEDGSHEDRRPAPPDTSLHEIASHTGVEDVYYAFLEVVEPSEPDHCVGTRVKCATLCHCLRIRATD